MAFRFARYRCAHRAISSYFLYGSKTLNTIMLSEQQEERHEYPSVARYQRRMAFLFTSQLTRPGDASHAFARYTTRRKESIQ